MGQTEVLDFLKGKREISDKYYTVREIQAGLKDAGYGNGTLKNVHSNVFKLVVFNVIEWRGKGAWKHHKMFRAKQPINYVRLEGY